MSAEATEARRYAAAVMGRGIWPDHWSPSQHDDFLRLTRVWARPMYQRHGTDWLEMYYRCEEGAEYRLYCRAMVVRATDPWEAAVVLASLHGQEPAPELAALASLLLASGTVEVVNEQGGER